mgnify:CR=1 FL=1
MLLFATAPFITAFLGWIFLRERVKLTTWIALIFAIFGIFLMHKSERVYFFELYFCK